MSGVCASRRPFYFGDNDTGWTADFDYLLREDSLTEFGKEVCSEQGIAWGAGYRSERYRWLADWWINTSRSDVLATLGLKHSQFHALYRKAFEVIRKQARNRNLIDGLMVAESAGMNTQRR